MSRLNNTGPHILGHDKPQPGQPVQRLPGAAQFQSLDDFVARFLTADTHPEVRVQASKAKEMLAYLRNRMTLDAAIVDAKSTDISNYKSGVLAWGLTRYGKLTGDASHKKITENDPEEVRVRVCRA